MHPGRVVQAARELAATGRTTSSIARELGVPRATVRDWVRGSTRRAASADACDSCAKVHRPHLLPRTVYSYLLGMYLGDGYIVRLPRTYRMIVTLDAVYPGIIEECQAAMSALAPENAVVVERHPVHRVVNVRSYSNRWPCLFPQHGAGPKHTRPIELADWQREITHEHPEALVRGLIHSDGCRVVNRVTIRGKEYRYPRYFFSNRSGDILGIFTEHLDLLDVAWRRDGPWNISVARKEAVARLDAFIGPKA